MTKTTFTKMNRRAACAALSMLVLSALTIAAPAKDGKDDNDSTPTRSRTTLSGPAISRETPNGHAEIRTQSERGRSRFNVEVEDVNLDAGTMLDVMVDHAGTRSKVGTIKLDALHSGELELNSQDGDTVPAVKKGDMVIVMNGAAAILSGVF